MVYHALCSYLIFYNTPVCVQSIYIIYIYVFAYNCIVCVRWGIAQYSNKRCGWVKIIILSFKYCRKNKVAKMAILYNFQTSKQKSHGRRAREVSKTQKSSFTPRVVVWAEYTAILCVCHSVFLTCKRQCSKILISGHYAKTWKVICGGFRHEAHNKKSLVILNASRFGGFHQQYK